MKLLLFISILFTATVTYGQFSINGKVLDDKKKPVPFATVQVKPTDKNTRTDNNGLFNVDNLSKGNYEIHFRCVGFDEKTVKVNVTKNTSINVVMSQATTELEQVTILGKSEATLLREAAYAVEVVETEGFKNSTVDASQLLGRISGVNIRQDGGLGSNFSLSLNGLSGNRIRTFINGIPMDYFGTSLTLNNFPVNQIEGIEVYKGAVPIHLSSDALGGAVNIVTSTKPIDYVDASYSYGNFNTHRASLNAQVHDNKTGFTARVKSFLNHSDNDYKIDVHLLDFESGKLADEPTEVRRFHDAYNSKMVWAEAGVMGKKFADELMFGVLYSENYKEIQQNPYATGTPAFPVGEAFRQEDKLIYNFTYHKKDLFTQGLNVNSYFVYVDSEENSVDVSPNRYDWFGNYEADVHPTTGEMGRKSDFTLNQKNLLGNVNGEYVLTNNHSVAVNYSLNKLTLQGADKHQPQNNTQFSNPNDVLKQVVGASYTYSAFNDKLSTIVFGKQYFYKLFAVQSNYQGTESSDFNYDNDALGYGLAATYKLRTIQFKASYEKAYRFPESYELFGDGLNVIPNQELLPEESDNLNLGLRWSTPPRRNRIQAELNGFVRNTKNYIRFEPRMNRSYYVNDPKVLAQGIDLTVNYLFNNVFNLSLAGTYLNLRNNDPESAVYKDRLPNEPYLFSNLTMSYKQVLPSDQTLTFTTISRYVHDFYLAWPSLAASESKSVIPSQLTHNIDVTYTLKDGRYNLSLLCTNIFDAKVYDNLNQQKPGRAFSIKARYFIQN
ncbi:TonB-dependent receptor [Flammeovirga agarivorans]|uniref:TonB-dependent receptor n=1 Tax=Flammeovirga agarivorans TaxID=2726742 RepID=A0A7X8XU32_9BACT|nr:TonB-dependent receptor [Flammeovirga agarivorans]NLR89854.1 TonB-dependent receptor [Flammeovirga agarivorans]